MHVSTARHILLFAYAPLAHTANMGTAIGYADTPCPTSMGEASTLAVEWHHLTFIRYTQRIPMDISFDHKYIHYIFVQPQIIEAHRAFIFVAPGWRVAPTGELGKSTQQIPLGDQHKSIMIVIKCPFISRFQWE